MNLLKPLALSTLLLVTAEIQAQISIPVSNLTLDYSLSSTYAVTLNLGWTSRSVYVDPFKIALTPGTISGPLATTGELAAIQSTALWFCMDPLQTIQYAGSGAPAGSTLVYQSINGADFNKYTDNTVAKAQNPSSYNGGLNSYEITALQKLFSANYAAASTSSLQAAALQIAIWEVVNESNTGSAAASYNLTGTNKGNFYISSYNSSTLINTAQGMLNALSNPIAFTGALDFLIDGTYTTGSGANCTTVVVQDLIGWAPPGPIPESANFAYGALGLIGVGMIAKWRSRKSKSPSLA